MNFKNRPWFEKPREKAVKMGIFTLSNAELISLLLGTGSRNHSVLMLAENLLNNYNGLVNLLEQANFQSLLRFKGIGTVKAIKLLSIIEVNKRLTRDKILKKTIIIHHPIDLSPFFPILFSKQNQNQELFYLISLDTHNQFLNYNLLFQGSETSIVIDLRKIIETAFINQAKKIICIHNHPSKNPTPSKVDLLTTKEIINLCQQLNLIVIDHIIYSQKQVIYSMFLKKQFTIKS